MKVQLCIVLVTASSITSGLGITGLYFAAIRTGSRSWRSSRSD
jgi:hypothetical protein